MNGSLHLWPRLGLVALALACSGERPPSDRAVRAAWRRQPDSLVSMCRQLRSADVAAIGRSGAGPTLAWGDQQRMGPPTEPDLAAAGLSRPDFEAWQRRLAATGVRLARRVERADGFRGVALVIHQDGAGQGGGVETHMWCGAAPPGPIVTDTLDMDGPAGEQCGLLSPPVDGVWGWWVCRRWG